MINEEWNKTQNDAPFVAFYAMRAVTFVLPDEMENVSIEGLQWFILIPRLNHPGSHRPTDSHSIPYLHRKKNIGFGTRTTQPAAILRITRKAADFVVWERMNPFPHICSLEHIKENSFRKTLWKKVKLLK